HSNISSCTQNTTTCIWRSGVGLISDQPRHCSDALKTRLALNREDERLRKSQYRFRCGNVVCHLEIKRPKQRYS
ncbi:hypothetical protein J6590_079811, partial [Homalodisca vitripennis]